MGEKRLSFDSTNDFILWEKNKVYLKLIEPSKIILFYVKSPLIFNKVVGRE